jgi:hypothetical protein
MEDKESPIELSESDMRWVKDVAFNEFSGKSDAELGDRCVNCVKFGDGVCAESGLQVLKTDCCWLFEGKDLK